MNLTEVLKALYASEINAGVQTFYDSGWDVWIGDVANGIRSRASCNTADVAAAWLDQEARKRYPKSEYAKQPPPLF